jgi:hypothetical protein
MKCGSFSELGTDLRTNQSVPSWIGCESLQHAEAPTNCVLRNPHTTPDRQHDLYDLRVERLL